MKNDNKKILKNLALYLGIPIILIILIYFIMIQAPAQDTYKYSDVLNYFETGQVKEYSLDLGTGEMRIVLTDKNVINYVVPDVSKFYSDARDDIDAYNEDNPKNKMVQDIIRPSQNSWFLSFLPTLILFALLMIVTVVMMRRLTSSMGGDKQMNFGKAKIKQISDEKRKTTFADVAGADEEKEELKEIV